MSRTLAALGAVLTAVALALTACGTTTVSRPVHGQVVAKTYQAARTTWTTQTRYRHVCKTKTRRSGKKTRTTTTCRDVRAGTRHVSHHAAACWELRLSSGRPLCVTHTRWSRTRVGDHI
ncbi:hypothetical protein [Streptomyces prunicolor]|uniref:hypothetical protein n=1 Tax=Streptomyces prunicolor TaxID=67348 RepID=UPI00037BE04B|nr:hypothetical protein [Streptomyces prunicolor]